MASVTGFGGMFVRASDPKALYRWYEQHLSLSKDGGAHAFPPPTQHPYVLLSFFGQQDAYFPPAQKAMLNLQVDDLDALLDRLTWSHENNEARLWVDDLDALLDRLTAEGVAVDAKRESYEFGKFGWITDPEGNRIELWQPIAED